MKDFDKWNQKFDGKRKASCIIILVIVIILIIIILIILIMLILITYGFWNLANSASSLSLSGLGFPTTVSNHTDRV